MVRNKLGIRRKITAMSDVWHMPFPGGHYAIVWSQHRSVYGSYLLTNCTVISALMTVRHFYKMLRNIEEI